MPFTRLPQLAATLVLWLLLAFMLAWTGIHMLRACGISVLGYQLSWCGDAGGPGSAVNRRQSLVVELAALERQYKALLLCSPAELQGGPSPLGVSPAPPVLAPSKATGLPDGQAGTPISPQVTDPQTVSPGLQTNPPAGSAGIGHPHNVAETSDGTSSDNPGNQPQTSQVTPPPGDSGSNSNQQGINPSQDMAGDPGAGLQRNIDTNRNGVDVAPAGAADDSSGEGSSQPSSNTANAPGGSCQTGRRENSGPILLALDHSKSMALPSEIDDGLATELEARMEEASPAGKQARDLYNSYIDQPGIKRLDVLKEAITRTLDELPPTGAVGLVTFAGCQGVVDAGLFEGGERGELLSRVQSLRPAPATPVAEALKAALARARVSGNGRVVLVTDGRDTCGGDPCAIARRSSGVRVDVLAIGAGRSLSCIAEATGGRLIEAAGATNIDRQLGELISGNEASCR